MANPPTNVKAATIGKNDLATAAVRVDDTIGSTIVWFVRRHWNFVRGAARPHHAWMSCGFFARTHTQM
jgi:hypothetical protein